ncbi:MAG: hypothetical protein AB4040_13960 [Synechococcus sp.]
MFTTQSPISNTSIHASWMQASKNWSQPDRQDRSHNPHPQLEPDSFKQPAILLLAATVLVLALIPTGTFKSTEAGPIAAIAGGGAIACLVADRRHSTSH